MTEPRFASITAKCKDHIIAIIPARGGSKRVIGKNIRPLAGKPLITYTIEAALGSKLFHRIVVSTDSEEIGAVARTHGAEVPFLRSAEISDDLTPVSAATADALERLDPDGEPIPTSSLSLSMANCPQRTAEDVVSSHKQFFWRLLDRYAEISRPVWMAESLVGDDTRCDHFLT